MLQWTYIVMFANQDITQLTLPMTLMDAVRCATIDEDEEQTVLKDIQDKYLANSYRITGDTLWMGHRSINLSQILVAFPIIKDADVENPDAYGLIGAEMNEDSFYPVLIQLTYTNESNSGILVPAYGPTIGRTSVGESYNQFVDINGVFLNTGRVRETVVLDSEFATWSQVREFWTGTRSQPIPSSLESMEGTPPQE